MSADTLLARLEDVKKTGRGKWLACCPAHADRTPSLSVREMDDCRILVHDFGGCSVEEVLSAIGLTFDDLYPPRRPTAVGYRSERRPWIPSDVFEIARHEIMIVSLIGCDLHKNKTIAEEDYRRLFVAVERLNDIGQAAYGK